MHPPSTRWRARTGAHAQDAGPRPTAACAGAEAASGAPWAGMLSFAGGLKHFTVQPGSSGSVRLPLGTKMPKKAGAASKARGESRGGEKVGLRAGPERGARGGQLRGAWSPPRPGPLACVFRVTLGPDPARRIPARPRPGPVSRVVFTRPPSSLPSWDRCLVLTDPRAATAPALGYLMNE